MSAVTAAAAAKQRAIDEATAAAKAANKALKPKAVEEDDTLKDGEGTKVVGTKPAAKPKAATDKPVKTK